MWGELAQVKSVISTLIAKISNKVRTEGVSLRFGIVAYRDHHDHNILEIQDFADAQDAIDFSKGLMAGGGWD